MPPTKRWLLDIHVYVPVMQDCWAYCFSSKAKDRHVHRLLVSRLVTNTQIPLPKVDFESILSTDSTSRSLDRLDRQIDSTRLNIDRLDRSTRSISRSTVWYVDAGISLSPSTLTVFVFMTGPKIIASWCKKLPLSFHKLPATFWSFASAWIYVYVSKKLHRQ